MPAYCRGSDCLADCLETMITSSLNTLYTVSEYLFVRLVLVYFCSVEN